jgi:hypothetical protein
MNLLTRRDLRAWLDEPSLPPEPVTLAQSNFAFV